MEFVEEIKSIFSGRTIAGLAYATVSGLASGTLGAFFEKWFKSKWAGYVGDIFGAGVMAYVADRYFGHPEWKGYAVFGALFPPIWEAVTDKISPEQIAQKASMALGMTWQEGATQAYQPVVVEVSPAPAQTQPAPSQPSQVKTAEVFNF